MSGPPQEVAAGPSRAVLRLVLLAIALRGVGYALLTPTYEGWDEYQHVAYLRSGMPTLGVSTVHATIVEDLRREPVPDSLAKQMPDVPLRRYSDFWSKEPVPWRGQWKPIPLYEAQHGFWYYGFQAWAGGEPADDGSYFAVVRRSRLANLAWTLAAVWFASVILQRQRVNRTVSDAVLCLLAVSSIWVMTFVRASNDAMASAMAFGAAACLSCQADIRRVGLGAVIIAAAGAVKATAWTLFPASLSLCWNGPQRAPRIMVLAFFFVLVSCGAIAFDIHRQGQFAPTQEAWHLAEQGKGIRNVIAAFPTIEWPREFTRRWGRELLWVGGWSFVPLPKILPRIHQWLLAASFAMLLWRLWKRGLPTNRAFAAFCVSCCLGIAAGQALHMAQSKAALGFVATPAWYAVIALPWLFAGLAWSWGFNPKVQRSMTAVFFTLLLVSEAVGVFLCWLPTFADSSDPMIVIERCSKLADGPLLFWTGTSGFVGGWIAACLALGSAIRKETA